MTTLIDSSPLLHERGALLDRLAAHGYLLFRGLMDPARLREVRRHILAEVAELGWLAQGSDPEEARPGATPVLEADARWWPGYLRVQKLESFHRLAHDDTLLSLLRTLFAEDVVVHPEKIARVIFPQNAGATTPPHQDYPNIGGTLDTFTVWMPLADTPRSEGGLRILPDTHRNGMLPVTVDPALRGAPSIYLRDVSLDDPGWATIDYRAGDVVMFHSLTVHAGQPNVSDRLRVSVDFRYQPVSEPVAEVSLRPHFFRDGIDQAPAWSELTEGWTTTRWAEVPAGMEVVTGPLPLLSGRIGSHAGARGGRSRFVASEAFAAQASEQPRLVSAVG